MDVKYDYDLDPADQVTTDNGDVYVDAIVKRHSTYLATYSAPDLSAVLYLGNGGLKC